MSKQSEPSAEQKRVQKSENSFHTEAASFEAGSDIFQTAAPFTALGRQKPSIPQVMGLQHQIGNNATRRYLQRYHNQDALHLGRALQPMLGQLQRETEESAPETQVSWVPRAPVVWQRSGESADGRMSWSVKGNAEFPDQAPDKPAPEIKVAELQTTLNNGTRELGTALAKYSEPLDTLNDFFGIPGMTFSYELAALEAVAKEIENGVKVDFNALKVAIKGQGKLDQNSIQSAWAKRLVGDAALYDVVLAGKMALGLEIEFSVGLKAEDVLRLVRLAQAHRQMLKMAVQNKAWMQRLSQMVGKGSAKARRQLRRMIAKNKVLARKLAAQLMPQAAQVAASMLGRNLLKLVPVLNAYFLAQDVIAIVETLYGILSGKGYSFGIPDNVESMGDEAGEGSEAGEGAEGEQNAEPSSGTEAPSEEIPEWLQGVEDEAAGGGSEFQAAELHPNAQSIVSALRGRGYKLNVGDKNVLNQTIPAELNAEQMQALLQMVKKAKPSQADVFTVLGQLVDYVQAPPKPNQDQAGAKDQTGEGDVQIEGGDAPIEQLGTQQGGQESDINFEDEVIKGDGGNQGEGQSQQADGQDQQGSDLNFEDELVQGQGNAPDNAENPEFDYNFEVRDFMKRALQAMKQNSQLKGYSEIEPLTFNSLQVGSRFEGLVTVYMGLPQLEWVGGWAKFRVVHKHPNGQLDVERDAMPAYNKHGKYMGVLQSQIITVASLS